MQKSPSISANGCVHPGFDRFGYDASGFSKDGYDKVRTVCVGFGGRGRSCHTHAAAGEFDWPEDSGAQP